MLRNVTKPWLHIIFLWISVRNVDRSRSVTNRRLWATRSTICRSGSTLSCEMQSIRPATSNYLKYVHAYRLHNRNFFYLKLLSRLVVMNFIADWKFITLGRRETAGELLWTKTRERQNLSWKKVNNYNHCKLIIMK